MLFGTIGVSHTVTPMTTRSDRDEGHDLPSRWGAPCAGQGVVGELSGLVAAHQYVIETIV